MRADRLLSILLHLQVHRRITAGELARRLEVSERTIYRDMEALGMAGIPVVAERGVHGGWTLLEEYRTNLTGLNEAEIQTLFLAKPMRLLADLNLDKAAEGALVKLLAALPTMHRRGAQDVGQRIHIDVLGWRQSREAVPLLPPLQEAVWQERRVRMTYRRSDGKVVERVVEPLGLVAKGSIWYLIASSEAEGEGEPRTYRVSRVLGADVLEACFARPAGFDLAAHWEHSSAQFQASLPRYPVSVRVEPAFLPSIRGGGWYGRIECEHPADGDGWIPLDLLFDDEHSAGEYLLGWGARVEVLAPQALRERIARTATEVVVLYGAHAAVTPVSPLRAVSADEE